MRKTETTEQKKTALCLRLEAAFATGACAAYDDLGITEPPWYLAGYSEEERSAWKRGLEQGYKDCEALWQKNK